jgi:hypothetical protein
MPPSLPTSTMTKRRSKANRAMDESRSPPGAAALSPTQFTGSSTTGRSCQRHGHGPRLPQPQTMITRHGPRHGDDTLRLEGSTEESPLLSGLAALSPTQSGTTGPSSMHSNTTESTTSRQSLQQNSP